MEDPTFPNRISSKVIVIAWLEIELTDYYFVEGTSR